MRAYCPNQNCSDGSNFIASATVRQEWEVTAAGQFVRALDDCNSIIINGPDMSEIWSCANCGTTAEFR